MVRFTADEQEIEALVRFLTRRSPGGLWMVPLEAARRDELRFRRTPRPFVQQLARDDTPLLWGLLPLGTTPVTTSPPKRPQVRRIDAPTTAAFPAALPLRIDPDESGLIALALGAPSGPNRRREGVLLTRDPLRSAALPSENGDEGADDLRTALVERYARRLRRKAERHEGRWILTAP